MTSWPIIYLFIYFSYLLTYLLTELTEHFEP